MSNKRAKITLDETATVTFNVGGTTFEVATSLIEQHGTTMLARLVSDTWQGVKDSDKASNLFIDRDGNRFAYVLDFLRYGHVTLPYHISRELFLLDLDFFGIEGATDETVIVGHDYYGHFSKVSEMHSLRAKLIAQVKDIDRTIAAISFSSRYFEQYVAKGSLHMSVEIRKGIDDEGVLLLFRERLHNNRSCDFALLNKCLKEYGLELFSFSWGKKGNGFDSVSLRDVSPVSQVSIKIAEQIDEAKV